MPRGFKALVTPLLKLLHPPSGVSIRKSQSSPANSAKCDAFSPVSGIYALCVCVCVYRVGQIISRRRC